MFDWHGPAISNDWSTWRLQIACDEFSRTDAPEVHRLRERAALSNQTERSHVHVAPPQAVGQYHDMPLPQTTQVAPGKARGPHLPEEIWITRSCVPALAAHSTLPVRHLMGLVYRAKAEALRESNDDNPRFQVSDAGDLTMYTPQHRHTPWQMDNTSTSGSAHASTGIRSPQFGSSVDHIDRDLKAASTCSHLEDNIPHGV